MIIVMILTVMIIMIMTMIKMMTCRQQYLNISKIKPWKCWVVSAGPFLVYFLLNYHPFSPFSHNRIRGYIVPQVAQQHRLDSVYTMKYTCHSPILHYSLLLGQVITISSIFSLILFLLYANENQKNTATKYQKKMSPLIM